MSLDLTEEALRLGEERDRLARLHDEAQALADGDADDQNASAEAIRYQASELDQRGRAVTALIEEYGPDTTVTVAGLDSGEYARVEDRVDTFRQQRDDVASVRGYHRNVYAAAGLVDAPFLDPDDSQTPRQRLDAKVEAVTSLPVGVTKWLYTRVDAQTGLDQGNWKPSSEPPSDTQED